MVSMQSIDFFNRLNMLNKIFTVMSQNTSLWNAIVWRVKMFIVGSGGKGRDQLINQRNRWPTTQAAASVQT